MPHPGPPSLTVIILTWNEGLHLRRCIDSLRPAVERICIIDCGSSDDTLQIAHELGAEVYQNAWVNHATQFNWALDHCGIVTDWVLRLDADEYLEPDLQAELCSRLPHLAAEVHGVLLKRKYYFLRRWVRFGGMHPIRHLRLWRNGSARIEPRWMDEHVVLAYGRTESFDGAFVDDNLNDVVWWSEKHVRYASLEALQVTLEEIGAEQPQGEVSGAQAKIRGQAALKRWVKQNLYQRLPFGLGPLLYVAYRLGPRLGLLDGWSGVSYHVLQGYWYRLLVEVRRRELRALLAGSSSHEDRIARLERATGIRIH